MDLASIVRASVELGAAIYPWAVRHHLVLALLSVGAVACAAILRAFKRSK